MSDPKYLLSPLGSVCHREMSERTDGTIIAVIGNIAVGKTTFCKNLKTLYENMGLHERVIILNESSMFSQERLDAFYEDPEANACSFQMYNENKRFEQMKLALWLRSQGYVVIMDNCLLFDIVFALSNKKYFSTSQWSAYKDTFRSHLAEVGPIDRLFYLSAPPSICKARALRRGRPCDEMIDLSYLRLLDQSYDARFETVADERRYCVCSTRVDWRTFRPIAEESWAPSVESGRPVLVSV